MLPTTLPDTRIADTGITRRQFFNRSLGVAVLAGFASLGSSTLAFLWPTLSKGAFGTKVKAGRVSDVLEQVRTTRAPVYVPAGRFYLTAYPETALPQARHEYAGPVLDGMEAGVVALYQKCVHLGCRVPWCTSSQWFECPCHQSKYDRVGEKRSGPAPRGLDRFGVTLDDDLLIVDTSKVILGPPVGTRTTGQEPEGPHCS